jgi:hypothetical protein
MSEWVVSALHGHSMTTLLGSLRTVPDSGHPRERFGTPLVRIDSSLLGRTDSGGCTYGGWAQSVGCWRARLPEWPTNLHIRSFLRLVDCITE